MANIYVATGSLTNPVNDLAAAQAYLVQMDMTQFVDNRVASIVLDVCWALTTDEAWKVTVTTHRLLTEDESAALSSWISGQNSDGLGEGFEQQPFAETDEEEEYCYEDDNDDEPCYDSDFAMSSFDWKTNNCELTLVK